MHMAIPDASLWIEPDGGHVPIFDDNAPAFADTVLRFLAETGNRTQVSTSTVPGVAK
jgi:pimeloyl-ACP methyl ester carboxylesterase